MSRPLLLLAHPDRADLVDLSTRRIDWLGSFCVADVATGRLESTLTAHRGRLVRIVTDSADEDYRTDLLPHVRGAVRKEVVGRKLNQLFRNLRYAGACRQGRASDGRRDDHYLFAALTQSDWLDRLVDQCTGAGLLPEAVCPLASAGGALLDMLGFTASENLILAFAYAGRLRISFFRMRRLVYSRLVRATSPDAHLPLADEIARTHRYLGAQRQLGLDPRTEVLLVAPHSLARDAHQALSADPVFVPHLIDETRLARALRLPLELLHDHPELALLTHFAHGSPSLDLAPSELRARARTQHLRLQLRTTSTVLGLGLAASAGLIALDTHRLTLETRHERWQAETLENENARRLAAQPRLAVPAQSLGQAVALGERISTASINPAPLYAEIGRILARHPDIRLDTLKIARPLGTPARCELAGELAGFDGNWRIAMGQVDALAEELALLPQASRIERLENPVDAAPNTALKGGAVSARELLPARFRLAIEFAP